MAWLVAGLIALLGGAVAALAAGRSWRWATRLGAGSAVAGCALGLWPALRALTGGPGESLRLHWSIPGGAFALGLDALSALFLVPVFLVCGLAAVYGAAYLEHWRGRRSAGPPWWWYNLFVASLAVVFLARNAVLFLMAWEGMTLASFFLVTFEHERADVRAAGWTYLVAGHLGVALVMVLFFLLGRGAGSLDFETFRVTGVSASLLFLLAVLGFGTKAGFVPMHIWLPEAHPAAPSHVSAVMSGVMIKAGIYGLVRTLGWLGHPPAWWGWLLIAIGLTSGVLGVVFALAQHDLKRLLAYHSVENIGIIALGLGLGVCGVAYGSTALTVLGFAGALLHVVNHALFKGLLFLGAGAVLHATGTREIDRLGGLLKSMPWTGASFLVGAAAISGLPPLNGFISEFLLYVGCFRGATATGTPLAVAGMAGIAGLALIGGLAAACFAKAFGIAFLGTARTEEARRAVEAPGPMVWPQVILAAACAVVAFAAPWIVTALAPATAQASGLAVEVARTHLADMGRPLRGVAGGGAALVLAASILALARRRLLASRHVTSAVTWGCAYPAASPRRQYTASSFARPLTELFAFVLRTKTKGEPPRGYFPTEGDWTTHTPDVFRRELFRPVFFAIARATASVRWLQGGQTQVYVLYVGVLLVALLVWTVR